MASANDLLRLYQRALTQDQSLQAALHARDAAVEARPQALAAYLPQLDASAGIQRQRVDTLSTTSRLLSAGTHSYATDKSWSVTLRQTIWSVQAYRQLRAADLQAAAAENTYLDARQDLILRVAQSYFNVLGARDGVRADIAARDAFKAALDEAQSRFHVGLATITDVQQAQARYDSSRATLIGDRRILKNQRHLLETIVGTDVTTLQPLRANIPLLPPDPATPAEWVATARQDNFDLRNADLQWRIAKRDVGVQRAQRYPTLSLQASVGQSESGGELNRNERQYVAGLALDIPIFDGLRIRSQVRQAAATAAQNQSQYELTRRNTDQQTRDAYQAVISGIAAVKAFRQAVQSNRTALESTQMSYRVGTQTEINVLTAQQNLYTALKSYYQSRYDYLDSVLTLKRLTGHLSERDLARVDVMLGTGGPAAPPQFPTLTPASSDAQETPATPGAK